MLLEVSNIDLVSPINLQDFETGLFYYTSTLSITKGNWSIVGTTPISDTDIQKTIRYVAGDVWIGDILLRKATESDTHVLARMGIHGHIALIEKLKVDLQLNEINHTRTKHEIS